jgi:hypothetical protein
MVTNKTEDKPESRIIGTKELAQRMSRTPRYVQQLAADKIIPSIKLPGRDRLFDWDKVLVALSRFEEKEIGARA